MSNKNQEELIGSVRIEVTHLLKNMPHPEWVRVCLVVGKTPSIENFMRVIYTEILYSEDGERFVSSWGEKDIAASTLLSMPILENNDEGREILRLLSNSLEVSVYRAVCEKVLVD